MEIEKTLETKFRNVSLRTAAVAVDWTYHFSNMWKTSYICTRFWLDISLFGVVWLDRAFPKNRQYGAKNLGCRADHFAPVNGVYYISGWILKFSCCFLAQAENFFRLFTYLMNYEESVWLRLRWSVKHVRSATLKKMAKTNLNVHRRTTLCLAESGGSNCLFLSTFFVYRQ